jgi:uncharacterized protein YjiS (DUF1127 family)
MPHAETYLRQQSSNANPLGFVLKAAAATIAALDTWQRTISTRRAIADLPSERLADIGHAEAPRPAVEVKAGLITNLMSMR